MVAGTGTSVYDLIRRILMRILLGSYYCINTMNR